MSVLKKVYPLGQVPQITTTQHRELVAVATPSSREPSHGLCHAAFARTSRDVAS